MIYFDNAATTKQKPKEVIDAFEYYVSEIGVSPGRGSYKLGIEASRMLFQARCSVASFFGLVEPNVVFTKNSTEAINMFVRGFLKKGDHVVISTYEHNAVLRPIEAMRQEGIIEYSVIQREDLLLDDEAIRNKYCKDNTTLLMMTLASNLTGRILYHPSLFKKFRERGVATFVDASQGAGKIKVNMQRDSVDYLAFTGHKDLKALPGVGGLCSLEQLKFKPFIQGGTGILGHEKVNPDVYPEGYEAGTLNMPAIWALKKAIEYTDAHYCANKQIEDELNNYLLEKIKELKNVVIYDSEFERVDTLGFNVVGFASNEVVQFLDKRDICTRGGIHCVILAHEALKTTKSGVVRVSLSEHSTKEEIDKLITELKEMGE